MLDRESEDPMRLGLRAADGAERRADSADYSAHQGLLPVDAAGVNGDGSGDVSALCFTWSDLPRGSSIALTRSLCQWIRCCPHSRDASLRATEHLLCSAGSGSDDVWACFHFMALHVLLEGFPENGCEALHWPALRGGDDSTVVRFRSHARCITPCNHVVDGDMDASGSAAIQLGELILGALGHSVW